MDCNRRQLLTLGGVGAVVALTGCLDVLDSGDSSAPYADDLVTDDTGAVVAFYTTWGEDAELGNGGDSDGNGSIIDGGNGSIIDGGNGSIIDGGNGGIVDGGNGSIVDGGNGSIVDGGDSASDLADPLLLPVVSPVFVGFVGGLLLGFTPLSPLLALDGSQSTGFGGTNNRTDADPGAADLETELDDVLMMVSGAGFAFSMNGDIDTGELDELLTERSDGSGFISLTYSRSREVNGHVVYEPETGSGGGGNQNSTVSGGSESEPSAIAVSGDRVILGPPQTIDQLVGNGGGSSGENPDTLKWLLGSTGDGAFGLTVHATEGFDEDTLGGEQSNGETGGGIGTDPGLNNETEAILEQLDVTPVGISGMMREAGGESLGVDIGLVFESDIDSELRETIESEFGTAADERSFSFDGDRVTVSGIYTETQ